MLKNGDIILFTEKTSKFTSNGYVLANNLLLGFYLNKTEVTPFYNVTLAVPIYASISCKLPENVDYVMSVKPQKILFGKYNINPIIEMVREVSPDIFI